MRFKNLIHGRDHGPQGSDPIPKVVYMDKVNTGDWIVISAFSTHLGKAIWLRGEGIYLDGEDDVVDIANAGGFNVGVTGEVTTITMKAEGSTPTHGITIIGDCVHKLSTVGNDFHIDDHNGNPIFQVREDGSVHIKTGTLVIPDL